MPRAIFQSPRLDDASIRASDHPDRLDPKGLSWTLVSRFAWLMRVHPMRLFVLN
jgi:hypothetical protein